MVIPRPSLALRLYYLCIVIKAERISNDSVDNGYSFPDEKDNLTAYGGGRAQLMVPGGLLQDISKCKETTTRY